MGPDAGGPGHAVAPRAGAGGGTVADVGAERLAARLGRSGSAFASNVRNRDLRRAQLSFLAAWTAEWAFTVALGVVA